jgi:hypothetical protein
MYNVFKRPMFKRGGPTKGTGIMSHVEPRRNYNLGAYGLVSQGMAYEAQARPNPAPNAFQRFNFRRELRTQFVHFQEVLLTLLCRRRSWICV